MKCVEQFRIHLSVFRSHGVSLYISVYHTTYTFHLHTSSSYLLSRFSPVAMVNVLHHMSHHTTVITLHVWVTLYISVYHTIYTFYLHTPSSYLLSRFSPVAMVNILHHISHHTTVITLHVWVTMRYRCICLYTIPPTHSTFTLPPLISSPGSHLWPRSMYYITPHHCYYTTRLCYNGVSLYISVYHTIYTFHLHTPSSYLLSMFSPVATVNVLHHISHHTTVITTRLGYNGVSLYMSVYTFYLHTPSSYLISRFSPVATVNVLHHICLYTIPPTHSTFTLPPLISSPGSHLWPRWSYRAWTRRQSTPHDASAEDDTCGRTAGNWHDIYWCNTVHCVSSTQYGISCHI